jgi:uncharacterized Zn-binding protein involved in type VI secretion
MARPVGKMGDFVAGGFLFGPLVPNVYIEGRPIAVIGTPVSPHGNNPHRTAVMVSGSPNVFAGNIPVCRAGDVASCGDTLRTLSTVYAN